FFLSPIKVFRNLGFVLGLIYHWDHSESDRYISEFCPHQFLTDLICKFLSSFGDSNKCISGALSLNEDNLSGGSTNSNC
ncbi:hypothetical protein OAU04_07475, partial [Alphaproteobacteria bacterium]|nr:hypothetical protein [Alphaproteobacteria bacterium]